MKGVLFLVSDLTGVSCRFRVLQYLPHLRAAGVEAEVTDLRLPARRRRRVLEAASEFETVVVHRAFLTPRELLLLRRAAPQYIYDFDDALMFRDSAGRRFDSWQRRLRFARMVRSAARVTAGNEYLAGWARRYNPGVTVIPTVVDLNDFPSAPEAAREPIVGWIGTRINLMYLRAIVPALTRLAEQRPGIRLKIVSDGLLDVTGVDVIKKPWSRADETADLLSFRVGIMPLTDDPWTRGKCALKILQYFAASVPVVCSPVGTNVEIVRHGENGYFARTEEEWVARLDELLANEETRRRFGRAGREMVERRYSVQARLGELLGVITALKGEAPSEP